MVLATSLTACSGSERMRSSTSNVPYSHAQTQTQQINSQKSNGSYDYTSWKNPLWQEIPKINMPKAKIVEPGAFTPVPFGQTAKLGDLEIKVLEIRDASELPPTPEDLKHEDYVLAIDLEVQNNGKYPIQLQPEAARFLLVNPEAGGKSYNMNAPINEEIRSDWRSMGYSIPISAPFPDSAIPYNDLPAFLNPGESASGTLIFNFGSAGLKLPPHAIGYNPFDLDHPDFALAIVENGDQLGAQVADESSIYGWGLLELGDLRMKDIGPDRYKKPPYPTNERTYPGWGGQQHWVKPGTQPQIVSSPQPSMEDYKTRDQENTLLENLFPSSAITMYAQRSQNINGTVKVILTQGRFLASIDAKRTDTDTGGTFQIAKLLTISSEFSYVEQSEGIGENAIVWHLTITNNSDKPLTLDSRNFAVVIKDKAENGGDVFQLANSAGLALTDTVFGSPSGMILQGEDLLPVDMPWRKIAPGQSVRGSIVFLIYQQAPEALTNDASSPDLTWYLLMLGNPQKIQSGISAPLLAAWEHS